MIAAHHKPESYLLAASLAVTGLAWRSVRRNRREVESLRQQIGGISDGVKKLIE